VLLFSATDLEAGDEAKKKAELKWAKEVTADFLDAGLTGNYASAEALLTADFKKALKEGKESVASLFNGPRGAKSWAIGSEEIAPDKDEASFRGAFKGEKGEATFSLRVAKEKESGKWRVSFFKSADFVEKSKK
jgi:hypothetical protein